jgi:molybdate transport system substrate-binding protein
MAAAALAGCGSGKDDAPVVYAAASLRDVLAGVDAGARYDFAGSGDLALRIEHGAPADLFLSAGPKDPQALFAAGRCERPVAFATNVLVLLVPARGAVRDVADLRRGRRRLAVAATGVPAGDYTRALLTRLGLSSILRTNRVSDETSVAGVTSKVALGSADAGFAYATDARVAGDRVRAVALPASAQPPIRYEGCVVRREGARATAARTVLRRLTSADGRAALRRAGFGLP